MDVKLSFGLTPAQLDRLRELDSEQRPERGFAISPVIREQAKRFRSMFPVEDAERLRTMIPAVVPPRMTVRPVESASDRRIAVLKRRNSILEDQVSKSGLEIESLTAQLERDRFGTLHRPSEVTGWAID